MREVQAGVGFVDVLVTFSSGLVHIVEMKILRTKDIPGPAQVGTYMNHRGRREGWLLFFDARRLNAKDPVPTVFKRSSGTIRTIVVDINPIPPSRQAEV
jgi:hypothetical protein